MVTPSDTRSSDSEARELAALAHGLARATARRRALGLRHNAAAPRSPSPPTRAAELSHIETQAHPKRAATPLAMNSSSASGVAPSAAPAAASAAARSSAHAAPRDLARACANLDQLRSAVEACRACELGDSRTRSVFADGGGAAGVLFLGAAPGFHEDQRGVPFVGDAGQLLTDIISKGMGLDRARDVTICNVLKCRPPDDRDPSPAEKGLCTGWLERQLELVAPKLVIALGRHAAGFLLGTDAPLERLRGRVHRRGELPVVVTYHPADLLGNPDRKKACWQDIRLALQLLGLPLPGRAPRNA